MQMYQVSFQTHYENKIDIGKVLICADSLELSVDLVIAAMDLPRSRTTCESVRIKPSIFKLERREVYKTSVVVGGNPDSGPVVPAAALSAITSRSHSGSSMNNYRCQGSAVIRAVDEDHALRRFATSIEERCASEKAMIPNYASKLILDCEQLIDQGHMKRLESVEMYKGKNLVGGR